MDAPCFQHSMDSQNHVGGGHNELSALYKGGGAGAPFEHSYVIEKKLCGGSQAPVAYLSTTRTYEMYSDRSMILTRETTEVRSSQPVETFDEIEIKLPAYEKVVRLGGNRKFDLNSV